MKFHRKTLDEIADMICGNFPVEKIYFSYRSSYYITRFFEDAGTAYEHDGSTRAWWVANTLDEILKGPSKTPNMLPDAFSRVIAILMDQSDALNEGSYRPGALGLLNTSLAREGFEAFYSDDRRCYLRHTITNTIENAVPNPHRPMSADELKRRELLAAYINQINEDDLINDILLPLFRQLGFHRITAAGHKDKAWSTVRIFGCGLSFQPSTYFISAYR